MFCLGGDDVAFLVLVEVRHALQGHVVALRRPAGEDDLFGICIDEGSNLSGTSSSSSSSMQQQQ
jgi:hypothetical protein